MRASAAASSVGPTSLMTSFVIGEPGWPASMMPIRPPIEVPTQCTDSTPSLAISVTMSFVYCAT